MPRLLPLVVLLACVGAPARLEAQAAAAPSAPTAPAATRSDSSAIEQYARVHHALNSLRDREQVDLAAPANKKVEAQIEVRERYRGLRAELYKSRQYTAAQYADMTQRISGDDALRAMFEAALERISKVR